MKKKKLNQLNLKKTTIASFKNQAKGGKAIQPIDISVSVTIPFCPSVPCGSITVCETITVCPTVNVCESANCPSLDRINCPDSINICIA